MYEYFKKIRESNNAKPKAPSYVQTPQEITKYYREAPIGSEAAILSTAVGTIRYQLATITGKRPRVGKVEIDGFGEYWMKSRENCDDRPNGIKKLVIPTDAVKAWATGHPGGMFGGRYEYASEQWRDDD